MTLDGKIAPPPGESASPSALGAGGASGGWITSVEARAHVQELRHASDAILVGVGTIVADDPLLTDRSGLTPPAAAARDPGFAPAAAAGIAPGQDGTPGRDGLLLVCGGKEKAQLEERGIRVVQVPLAAAGDGRPDLGKVLEHLGGMEITSLIIEGGALVNWAALDAGVVDKVFLYYAPKILAGTGSVPFAGGTASAT